MDLTSFLLLMLGFTFVITLAVAPLCIAAKLLDLQANQPAEDPIENILLIGLDARNEMDRISGDFVAKQIQKLSKKDNARSAR